VSQTPSCPQDAAPAQHHDLRRVFLRDPDVTFLNHGSFGACPRPVFEAYQAWQAELQRQPIEFLGRRFNELMRTARESLAAYVGADADDLVYVPNPTTGLNTVARSLRLQPDDELLNTDHEYGALDRMWRFVCQKRGLSYVNRPISVPVESSDQVVDALWPGITERTRVLFLSHITSPTALILPIAELVRRAHERGIITVIDGAHAPGQIPLDLATLGACFYAGNCHELVCATRGAITELTELEPISPDTPEWYAQMVTVPLPPCDAQVLQQRLYNELAVEVPIITWRDRQFIRIAIQGYKTPEDLDALLRRLRTLLP